MMKRIDKLIEAYNKKAEKWGYTPIVMQNGRILNEFDEKETDGLPFLKRLIVLYRNGYLKEDYEKIQSMLGHNNN